MFTSLAHHTLPYSLWPQPPPPEAAAQLQPSFHCAPLKRGGYSPETLIIWCGLHYSAETVLSKVSNHPLKKLNGCSSATLLLTLLSLPLFEILSLLCFLDIMAHKCCFPHGFTFCLWEHIWGMYSKHISATFVSFKMPLRTNVGYMDPKQFLRRYVSGDFKVQIY